MLTRRDRPEGVLAAVLVVAALVELILLRAGTRTLIHIPGLGAFETPIRYLAETGRFAFRLALVSLVAFLTLRAVRYLTGPSLRLSIAGGGVGAFVVLAGMGRLGLAPVGLVGWLSVSIAVLVLVAGWHGRRSVPLALFVCGVATAAVASLGQGIGGRLSLGEVDLLIALAEMFVVTAGMATPLILSARPTRAAILAGAVTATVVLAAFASASSTASILILWNLGVPGWLPAWLYAVALGAVVTTAWSAVWEGDWMLAGGLALLITGGVGTISTYQSGLVLAGIVLAGSTVASEKAVDEPVIDTAVSLTFAVESESLSSTGV